MATESINPTSYFVLTAWCTTTKAWRAVAGRYDSPGAAQRMATERGIYRVVYVCEGRQCALEPFAIVGDD